MLAALAAPGIASAQNVYLYEITMSGSGTGDFLHPTGFQWLTFSGSLSASWTIKYPVRIAVYPDSKTVTLEPINPSSTTMWATSISGSASFDMTTSCSGPPCTGSPNHCTYAGIQFGMNTMNAIWESDAGPDYGDGHAAYLAGKVRFYVMSGWRGGAVGSCVGGSDGTGINPSTFSAGNDDLVGISWTSCHNVFDIPVSQLGKTQISAPSEADPTGCQTDIWNVPYTAHVQRTTTMRLLSGPPKPPPTPGTKASVKIGSATLDLTDRLKRHQAKLKDEAAQLGRQKLQLEQEAIAAGDRATTAIAAEGDLTAKQQALDKSLTDVRTALARLRAEEAKVPGVSALLAQESTIGQQLVTVENGGAANAAKVAQLSKQLDAVEALLRERLAGSPVADLRSEWSARVSALTAAISTLLTAQNDTRAAVTSAELELTRLRSEIGSIDTRLMVIAEQLAVFEPQVTAIAASADEQPVFHAAAGTAFVDLNQLDDEIDKQNAVIERLKAANAGARDAYFAAAKDTIASGNRLASTLKGLAYARFGTDLFFDSVDIVQATAKGGVVGAVAELGKKLIEKAVLPQPDAGIEPGSPEDEVNKLYQAGLKDAWSAPALETTAVNRAIKETVSKGTKDTLNQKLGSYVFDKVEFPIRFKLEVERRLLKGTASDYERAEKALQNLSKQVANLKKGYGYLPKNVKADKVGTLASLGETLVKEATKTLVKGALDKIEHAAWLDYYEASLIEKAFYPLYRTGISKISDAYEVLDSLLVQKGQLLEGLPAQPGMQPDSSIPFARNAQLEITLTLHGNQDPTDPLTVTVGGATATRKGSTNVYDIAASKAQPETDGTLAIVVK